MVTRQNGGTAWLYYHADALGSTRSLTDGLGDVVGSYAYAPFGSLLYTDGPAVDFRFTGEQADDPTGLYFLRARYYDPTTGRFTQRDPFAGMLKTPQTLNPYLYAINNPVILTDYSGKSPFPFPSLCEVGSNAQTGEIAHVNRSKPHSGERENAGQRYCTSCVRHSPVSAQFSLRITE